jgi:pSer/pThr/pTyr-binding forkhead associated (FHA) protein
LRIDWSVLATILRERPEIAARMIQQLAVQLERLYDGVVAADRPAMAPSAGGPATASPAAGGPNVDGVTAALVHEPTGRSFPLRPGGALVVGRPGADGVLHADIDLSELDPLSSISRRHARIEGRADGFYACEQAPTTNGTLVDGVRIGVGEEVKLVSGSKIQFGGVEMMFRQAESGC